MDARVFLYAVALFTLISSSTAVWIYFEPRFDAEFMARTSVSYADLANALWVLHAVAELYLSNLRTTSILKVTVVTFKR